MFEVTETEAKLAALEEELEKEPAWVARPPEAPGEQDQDD